MHPLRRDQVAIGFAARVPNTIDGAERLGLDVRTWVSEGLVDILIPATLYATDLEEDITEWVERDRDQTFPNCLRAERQSYELGESTN